MSDVVIVGGGMAGLSAAVVLGRFRFDVTVIDAGAPRNAPAAHSQGYLTRDGAPPGELLAAGRAEARSYGVRILPGTVAAASGENGAFVVETVDGQRIPARQLLVTTGLADRLPDVAGLAGRFGRDVLACPFCHGYEARDRVTVTLAASDRELGKALLLRRLTDRLTVLCAPGMAIAPERARQLAASGIAVRHGEPAALLVAEDRLTGVRTADGHTLAAEVLYVNPAMDPLDGVLRDLGAATAEGPFGAYVAVDEGGATSVPGLWAAGNVTDPFAQLVHAASQGYRTASRIVADLSLADATARAEAGAPFTAAAEQRLCAAVAGDRAHGLAAADR